MVSVMWFRRDFRLMDNKALYHALNNSEQLILIFQINPDQFICNSYNHRAFFSSLRHFKEQVDTYAHLQVFWGDPLISFRKLKNKLPEWNSIYFNSDETGYGSMRDQQVQQFFDEEQIKSFIYQDAYLHGSQEIKKNNNDYYQVFTPYYKKWIEREKESPINYSINFDNIYSDILFSEEEYLYNNFMKKIELIPNLEVGEKAALDKLEKFVTYDLVNYEKYRDYPNMNKTSRLSTHLRTGEISIRTVLEKVIYQKPSMGRDTFIKELCWRDFYNMIYSVYPNQKKQAIKKEYRHINWDNDFTNFEKWKNGETGYPIVDSAMRQLKETGWMHNRLRMIVASFLVKDLLIDWRFGEQYFQKMLIDYDPASNIGGWQWSASTGTDSVPYFRIFNPTNQSQKFDLTGNFIRKYIPELKNVSNELIHQPEKMTKEEQRKFKVLLGTDYPYPIVIHKERRKKAIQLYEDSKELSRLENK